MSAAIVEVVGSRETNVSMDNPTVELMFVVTGTFDDAEIRAAIESELDPTWPIASAFFGVRNLFIQSYHFRQRQEGNYHYDGTATYGRTQPRKTGEVWFSFDGTGGTAHVSTSEGTSSYGKLSASGPPTNLTGGVAAGGSLTADDYYYCVTAVGPAGETTATVQVAVATSGGNLTVELDWTAVDNATSYKVYRSTTSNSFVSPCLIGTTTATSFTDDGSDAISSGAPPTSFEPLEPPDFENAINVNNETVEGTDKVVPYFKFRLDYYPAVSLMTPNYISKLYLLTGKTNVQEVTFGGLVFKPGELLFMGPTGQPRGYDDWEIGMHFIASPNLTDIKIGDIKVTSKKGHDYLWVLFNGGESRAHLIKRPEFAYVEQIYSSGNYSDLGIDGIPVQSLANP